MEDLRKVLGQATHKPPTGFITWLTNVRSGFMGQRGWLLVLTE